MNAIAQVSAAPARGPKLDNRRVLAAIVDLLIVAAGGAVVLFAGDALSSDTGELQGALGVVVLGWALYYFFALESGEGQTVGKKLMKLRVVKADGSPAGMREVAVRTILRVVDNYLVGLIVMLATGERRQRIGDLAAGTIVVDASGPALAAPAPVAEPVEAEEEPVAAAEEDVEADPATSTITLPARPTPPTTVSDLSAPAAPEATDVPELRPFPPVGEEPVAEEPVADEPAAEEPAAEEPVAEEPVAEEPVLEAPVAEEPFAEEAAAEEAVEDEFAVRAEPPADEPAAEELPAITSPSIEELAQDVVAAQAVPVQAEPADAEPEPVEAESGAAEAEPVPVEESAPVAAESVPVESDPEPVEADVPADDEPVNVKSVETVSAIDLIMGGASEDEGSQESSHESGDSAS